MKLSITQIILGAFIVFAACFIVGWMTYQAPTFLRQPWPNDEGKMTTISVIPEHKALFDVSRYGSYFLPAPGIFLIITGTVQSVRAETRTHKLSVAIIISGALVAALAFIITGYGYPLEFHTVTPDTNNLLRQTSINPAKPLIYTQLISAATLLAGLAVIGSGIAQLFKTRKPYILVEQR
jgi:hypothetical protein